MTGEVYRSGDGAQDDVGLGGGVRAAADSLGQRNTSWRQA